MKISTPQGRPRPRDGLQILVLRTVSAWGESWAVMLLHDHSIRSSSWKLQPTWSRKSFGSDQKQPLEHLHRASMAGNLPEEQRMHEVPLQADGLVRHPRPYPTESLFGYILRLAEENGYPTPHRILALVGIRDTHFSSRRIPLRELARIAHRDLCELDQIAYCTGPRQYCILGRPVANYELKARDQVSLCPECVRSAGFIEAQWDLE